MNWKEFVVDYLSFSKKDRVAIIAILILVLAIFFLPEAISSAGKANKTTADTAWIATMKRLEQTETREHDESPQFDDHNSQTYQYDRTQTNYDKKPKGELFYFDPNTLPGESWAKLGLRQKTINTILNYLNKGGRFIKTEDLQRIYGLHQEEYERLAPFVKIETVPTYPIASPVNNSNNNAPAKTKYQVIDINAADTTSFISLPGIGSKLAARIVNFRDKLGGFYSVNQVAETFGLPDSTFQKIKQYLKLENASIKKININTATIDELKTHPYIKWSIANPLVAYRNEHGLFAKVEDIRKVMAVTDDIYNKIRPYLITE